jgi:hypothetical protein
MDYNLLEHAGWSLQNSVDPLLIPNKSTDFQIKKIWQDHKYKSQIL